MISKLMRLLGMQPSRAARVSIDGPVEFETGFEGSRKLDQGRAKDLSATGIYFEADNSCAVNTRIHFTVELAGAGGTTSVMHCSGVIVRRESLGNQKIGYGVRIDQQRIVPK